MASINNVFWFAFKLIMCTRFLLQEMIEILQLGDFFQNEDELLCIPAQRSHSPTFHPTLHFVAAFHIFLFWKAFHLSFSTCIFAYIYELYIYIQLQTPLVRSSVPP